MATIELDAAAPAGRAWLSLRDDTGASVPFLADGATRDASGGAHRGHRHLPGRRRARRRVPQLPRHGAGQDAGTRRELAREPGRPAAAGERRVRGRGRRRPRRDPVQGAGQAIRHRAAPAWRRRQRARAPARAPCAPALGRGPWLLCPAGPGTGTGARAAAVRVERCPVGGRLVAELELGGLVITQETLLWDGADRVEFRTHVDGSIGQDRLLRVVFPADVPGGLPVYQTAVAVVGQAARAHRHRRGRALLHARQPGERVARHRLDGRRRADRPGRQPAAPGDRRGRGRRAARRCAGRPAS